MLCQQSILLYQSNFITETKCFVKTTKKVLLDKFFSQCTFFYKMHISRFNFKKYNSKSKMLFLTEIFEILKFWWFIIYILFFFYFKSRVLVSCFRLRTSSTKRECRDENLFVEVKVTLRKFNSLLQYYKIDLSFSIKL